MIDCLPSGLAGRRRAGLVPRLRPRPLREGRVHGRKAICLGKGRALPRHLREYFEAPALERQLLEQFRDILGLSAEENQRAVLAGYENLNRYHLSTAPTQPGKS